MQQLTEDTPVGVYSLFLRSPGGSYRLITDAPLSTPVPSPAECGSCFQTHAVAFAGASVGYGHILFQAKESFVGAPEGVENLYENAEGSVRYVGYLPDGAVAAGPGGSAAGAGLSRFYSALERGVDALHAISEDGSHIVFRARADGGAPDPAQSGLTEVYDRVNGASTIELSAPAPGASPANSTPEPAQFWAASAGGSLVFFTSTAELTTDANTGIGNVGQNLYRYDTSTEKLEDLTVDTNPSDSAKGADVLGVVGSSTDGAYVYFVATGQLVPGEGVDGQPTLYVWHEGNISFIATLTSEDKRDWALKPVETQAYATPDGRHLAFMSLNRLTGYDNTDQNTDKSDDEVYLYDAKSSSLACASCDPNGARPTGSAFIGATLAHEIGTPFHQPRSVSDDGSRLFFSSPDPLTAEAGNPYVKVFEYKGGQVHLISGAVHSSDDMFLDASASGNDVFFASRDRLVAGDQDELVDIYDARIGGGIPSPTLAAPCVGSACQGAASIPPVLLAPSSITLAGSGNLVPPMSKPTVKGKQQSKKKKRKRRKGRHASVAHRRWSR
jgi:hypothetical protein